jgi:hypothetical protein
MPDAPRLPCLSTRDDHAPAELSRLTRPGGDAPHRPRHPRLRLRRASGMVVVMFVQSPAGHDGRETSKDRHGEMTAVCGFFMRLRACVAASSYTSMPGG